MLTVDRIEQDERFAGMAAEWDALLRTSAARCIFLTWEWLHTWRRHLGQDRQLSVIAVREGGELVGVAPLVLSPPRPARLSPLPTFEFLGTGEVGSDYLDLVAKPGCEGQVLDAVAVHVTRSRSAMRLRRFEPHSALAAKLATHLADTGWRVTRAGTETCPFIRLDGHTWDSYLATLGRPPTDREQKAAERFLLAWLVPAWVLLELVPTKLPHYVLPLAPALALLAAAALADGTRLDPATWTRRLDWLVRGAWALVSLGLAVLLIGLPLRFGDGLAAAGVLGAVLLIALASALLWYRPGPWVTIGLVAALSLVFVMDAALGVLPRLDRLWLSRAAAGLVARHPPAAGAPLVAVGYSEPSLVFLLGTSLRLATPQAAAETLASGGEALVSNREDAMFRQAIGTRGLRVGEPVLLRRGQETLDIGSQAERNGTAQPARVCVPSSRDVAGVGEAGVHAARALAEVSGLGGIWAQGVPAPRDRESGGFIQGKPAAGVDPVLAAVRVQDAILRLVVVLDHRATRLVRVL
jgi:hypothetical protein